MLKLIFNVTSTQEIVRKIYHRYTTMMLKIKTTYIFFLIVYFKFIVFQLFLSLIAVAVCEAGIITNADHSHHAVYHGHGATSYQNVQVDNHDTIVVPANYGDPVDIHETLEHHHEPLISIVDAHNDLDHIVSHSGKLKHKFAINQTYS